jgi:hypothetical protein
VGEEASLGRDSESRRHRVVPAALDQGREQTSCPSLLLGQGKDGGRVGMVAAGVLTRYLEEELVGLGGQASRLDGELVPATREALARAALGEEASLPVTIDEAHMHVELRAWFEREMRTSRHEGE